MHEHQFHFHFIDNDGEERYSSIALTAISVAAAFHTLISMYGNSLVSIEYQGF